MITIRFSARRSVDVNKGMSHSWPRKFRHDDIRVPDGWVHSLEINGRMYRFSFAHVSNAKIPADNYIIVIDAFSREQALGEDVSPINERWYVCRVMDILKPYPEELANVNTVDEYLRGVAVATFTKTEMEVWRKEKKLVTL